MDLLKKLLPLYKKLVLVLSISVWAIDSKGIVDCKQFLAIKLVEK